MQQAAVVLLLMQGPVPQPLQGVGLAVHMEVTG